MGLDDGCVLLLGPPLFLNIGVQVVVPSLTTLLADSAREILGDITPVTGSVLSHQLHYDVVLLLTLSQTNVTQGPLISLGFSTFCHLWRHCTSDLSSK